MDTPSSLQKLWWRLDAFRLHGASRETIERRQRSRLRDLLEFVTHESRYYKRLYEDVERPVTDLTTLPPVTKPDVMANFDDLVTDTAVELADVEAFTDREETIGERFLERYPVWLTSGTTGEPGVFLQDDWAMTTTDAVGDRWSFRDLLTVPTLKRLIRNNARTAEIAVGGGHFAAASGVELFRREHPFLQNRMRLFSPDQPIADLVAALQDFQPAIVVGYSTVLLELERKQRAGRLDIAPAYIAPSGEPITDAQKDRLRETFDCVVREIYGATEFYGIAVECEQGNLHVNADWVVLEPVDEDYQPVDPGEPSDTVLLTNLANRIQPLVRYDLGDSVTMYEEPCACGSAFPVIEVEGRQGEVLHFETVAETETPFFPLALSSTVKEVPGVHRTQLIKTGPTTLTVRLDVEDDADEERVWEQVETDLRALFEAQDVEDVSIERAAEPPARNERSGKFRHVWSTVDE